MKIRKDGDGAVLVGVLKSRRDLEILLKEHWYRIPKQYVPKQRFSYVAFYQPVAFGRQGKRILYYAKVLRRRVALRRTLLPSEPTHPRASERYVRLEVGPIKTVPRIIRNTAPRRISFGFTTLEKLLHSKNILELYDVAQTEEILKRAFKRSDIRATSQYHISSRRKGAVRRYCLDFAIFCNQGAIAIECDNTKAHAGPRQQARDRAKDDFLRQRGWTVIRLGEREIISSPKACLARVQRAIKGCGGFKSV